MTKDFSISLDVTGSKVTVIDQTEWGTGEDPINRNSIALIAGISKFNTELSWISLDPSPGYSQVSYDTSFTNSERTEFCFDLGEDGYHIVRFIFAPLNDNSSTAEGSVYYDTALGSIFLLKQGVWTVVSPKQLFQENTIMSSVMKEVGFNPKLEKMLDFIWQRYENDAFPANGKDYTSFYTGYGMLVSSISSLRQENFAEYDRKITLANRLVKRWK